LPSAAIRHGSRAAAAVIRRWRLAGSWSTALTHSPRPQRVAIFRETATDLIESKRPGWRNPKHAAQWSATLEAYVDPALSSLDVKAIETTHVLAVLRRIWIDKPETASRVRQRIEAVLDFASAQGLRTGLNPALQNLLPKPSHVRRVEHHSALDWCDLPVLMARLAAREGVSASALAFLILTAARSGEVRGMRWAEIDLTARVWTVPQSA
jgi:integrase